MSQLYDQEFQGFVHVKASSIESNFNLAGSKNILEEIFHPKWLPGMWCRL